MNPQAPEVPYESQAEVVVYINGEIHLTPHYKDNPSTSTMPKMLVLDSLNESSINSYGDVMILIFLVLATGWAVCNLLRSPRA